MRVRITKYNKYIEKKAFAWKKKKDIKVCNGTVLELALPHNFNIAIVGGKYNFEKWCLTQIFSY